MRELTYNTRSELIWKLDQIKHFADPSIENSDTRWTYCECLINGEWRKMWEEWGTYTLDEIPSDHITTEELADYIIAHPDEYEYSHD